MISIKPPGDYLEEAAGCGGTEKPAFTGMGLCGVIRQAGKGSEFRELHA